MPRCSLSVLLLTLSALVCASNAHRPVIIMHGILTSSRDMETLVSMVAAARPGTSITNVDAYNYLWSVDPLWKQVDGVYEIMKPVMEDEENGVILICYSQGSLKQYSAGWSVTYKYTAHNKPGVTKSGSSMR